MIEREIIWKDVDGYSGLYMVSNNGLVKSLDRCVSIERNGRIESRNIKGRILNPDLNKDGYYTIKLSKDGVAIHKTIHRLVGLHFVPNPFQLPVLNHKDADKLNNNDWNFEWTTEIGNTAHAKELGLLKGNGGLKGSQLSKKFTEESIVEIRNLYLTIPSCAKIASVYDVTPQCIRSIIKKETWRHVA